MAPLVPVFLALFSLLATPALAGSLDLNDFMADHRAEQDRAHERQMQEWRAEEQAAYYRQQADTQRMNQPSQYENSRNYDSTEHFSLWQGNDPTKMQACTSTKYDVSCY